MTNLEEIARALYPTMKKAREAWEDKTVGVWNEAARELGETPNEEDQIFLNWLDSVAGEDSGE